MTKPAAIEGKKGKLNAAQKAFCDRYAVVRNATQAYLFAYPGNRPEIASVSAWALLRNPKVRLAIRDLEQDALARNGITQDRILQEYKALAFSDITRAVNVSAYNVAQLAPEVRAALKKVKHTEGEAGSQTEYEMHPKQAALDKLAEIAGLIKKDEKGVQINGQNVQVIFE